MPINTNANEPKVIQMDTTSTDMNRGVYTANSDHNRPSTLLANQTATTEAPAVETANTEQAPPETGEVAKVAVPDQEARSLFVKAQKAERRAQAQLKKAQEMTAKADKFEKAMAETNPAAKYQALGLDPQKEYQKLTEYALKQMEGGAQVDPVQERFKAQEAQLKAVAEALQKQQDDLKQREENQQLAQALHTMVVPFIQKDPDRYETLIVNHGGDAVKAAMYVFNTAKSIYMEQGASPPFEEIADGLEKYHTDLIESGINATLKMKKFKDRLALASNSHDQQADLNDQTMGSKAPNKPAPKVQTSQNGHAAARTREERNALFMQKFGK